MIPIEKLCITLEQAKHLKDLGVVQESYFYWGKYDSEEHKREWTIVSKETKDFYEGNDETYSAFTIGEMYVALEQEDAPINHEIDFDFFKWGCIGGFGCGEEYKCKNLSLKDFLYRQIYCQFEYNCGVSFKNKE